MNLKENNVNVEIEFAPDPEWYRNSVKTTDNLKKHLEDFFEYLKVELIVKEVNTTSGVETETVIEPYYEIYIEPNGSPRLEINNTEILVRADPFIPGVKYRDRIRRKYDLKDDDWTRRQLLSMADIKGIKNADDVIDLVIEQFNPSEEKEAFEPVNAITSIIRVSPNIQKMEEKVVERFVMLDSDYLQSVNVISEETIAEAMRIQKYLEENPYVESFVIRNSIYEDFLRNCSRYMVTLVMNDAFMAQNEKDHAIKIQREQRLFTKKIDATSGNGFEHKVQLTINELDRSNDLMFPSTAWLFAEEPDPDFQLYQKSLVHSSDVQVDSWPSFTLTNPDPVRSPIKFGDSLFSIQFYQNPVSKKYEK